MKDHTENVLIIYLGILQGKRSRISGLSVDIQVCHRNLTDKSQPYNGIIDPTGVLELVTFLEETFAITVEDEELIPENLDSVENVVKFLVRKRNGGKAPS